MSYADSARRALASLKRKGKSVTVRSYTQGAYDPATGTSSATSTESTRTGVFLPFKTGQTHERGTLIQSGDKRILLDPYGDVNLQDRLMNPLDSVEYTIVSIDEINPAGTRVLYDIHLRT